MSPVTIIPVNLVKGKTDTKYHKVNQNSMLQPKLNYSDRGFPNK